MTYEKLKKIAQPHIREGAELPSNSFLLLNQLHIPFKNEIQCKEDYKGKLSPLYNTPAFLAIKGSEKTIYFNGNTSYWNFYIFHEIAHFLLGHEDDCPQNEMDADMLACILAAPIENLPSYLKTARDLSCLCKIPIDKAERYWQKIYPIAKSIGNGEKDNQEIPDIRETIAEVKSKLISLIEKLQFESFFEYTAVKECCGNSNTYIKLQDVKRLMLMSGIFMWEAGLSCAAGSEVETNV